MMKEQNVWNEWYFIQQLQVNLYHKRDANPWTADPFLTSWNLTKQVKQLFIKLIKTAES